MIYLCSAAEPPSWIRRRLAARGVLQHGKPVRWLYLGRDYRRAIKWEAALGPTAERIRYADQLQDLALSWRSPYLNWLTKLAQANDGLCWWSSRLAERSTTMSSLFHAICYLKIGLDFALGAAPPVLIITENVAVRETIARHSGLRAATRVLRSPFVPPEVVRLCLCHAVSWSLYFLNAVTALKDARWTRRDRPCPPIPPPGAPRILLHSCIDESYFGEDGEAHDRYFPGLIQELRRCGYEVLILPWLFEIKRTRKQAFHWFRQHPGEYLIAEDYYSFADYLWAASVVLRQALPLRGVDTFVDMDVTQLVRYARRRQGYQADVATFVRYVRLVKKLATLGVHIDIFLDTFENMLTEKPQVMAFRRWMPNVMTVGYQHYAALFPLGVGQFTTPEEAVFAPHPDVIVCNSPLTARQLKAAGFPRHKLRVGPSLRFRHLTSPPDERAPEANRVLVLLSLDEIATIELLCKLRDAFPREEGLYIWIKPHPMMSKERVNALLRRLSIPTYMECVDGKLETWLPHAACAVTTASTSALELALAAVPTIVVGRETDFDMNPLGWFPDLERPVYTAEELRGRVMRNLSLSDTEKSHLIKWACRMRRECISPVSEVTLTAFVDARAAGHM